MAKRQRRYVYTRFIKRLLDIAFSAAALLLTSPFALLCALAIKIDDPGGSVLFCQLRNGRDGKVFSMAKFRTMKRELCGADLEPTADTLTRPGRIIRKLSFDEIPQLVQILTGQMSLIGPRPLPLSYYEWFTDAERARFAVRPGITGLSQVNGGAELNWDKRFATDVKYVENLSFGMDVSIFIRTFLVVLTRKDVVTREQNTLENFDDYRRRQNQGKLLAEAGMPKEKGKTKKSKLSDKATGVRT
jgi:lipopolysaccharide/colanic/teichoic acid biosynthesis glycosyltransferase